MGQCRRTATSRSNGGQSPAPRAAAFAETVDGQTYLLGVIDPPSAVDALAPTLPRELVFLLDVSGSMHGLSLAQAKRALLRGLARLGPLDRFNVVAFNHEARPLFRGAVPADAANLDRARAFVDRLAADGGTEIAGALGLALDGAVDPARLRQIVLLTDGAVGNEAALFRMIGAGLGDSRLFTVGIGSAPTGYLMRKAAAFGRGAFTLIG